MTQSLRVSAKLFDPQEQLLLCCSYIALAILFFINAVRENTMTSQQSPHHITAGSPSQQDIHHRRTGTRMSRQLKISVKGGNQTVFVDADFKGKPPHYCLKNRLTSG